MQQTQCWLSNKTHQHHLLCICNISMGEFNSLQMLAAKLATSLLTVFFDNMFLSILLHFHINTLALTQHNMHGHQNTLCSLVMDKMLAQITPMVSNDVGIDANCHCSTDEPPMSDLGHTNGIYNSPSPAMGGRQGGNNHASFPLEHGVLPSQDQFHEIRSNSPYGLPQSPGSLQALPRHQPLITSLVYPDSGLSIMTQGSGINPAVRVSMGTANGPSSDLSTGSSGGYPDFPASPASWLDEVDHGQF